MKIIVKRSNLQQPRRLTQSEFEALKPYEAHMKTALTSDWTRGLGRNGIKIMSEIRDAATGRRNFVNASCPVCVLKLVREVARMYNAYRDYLAEHPVKPSKPGKPSKPSKPAEEVEKPAQPAVGVSDENQEPAPETGKTDGDEVPEGYYVEELTVDTPPAIKKTASKKSAK